MSSLRTLIVAAFLLALGLAIVPPLGQGETGVSAAEEVTVSGTLHVIRGDPPGLVGEPRTAYILTDTTGEQWTLQVPPAVVLSAGGPAALDKRSVQATGEQTSDNTLRVHAISRGGIAGAFEGTLSLSGAQKFITILCKFADVAAEPQPLSFFDDMFKDTAPGQNHFWREVSYNTVNLSGSEQYNWRTLPENRAEYIDFDHPDNQGANLGKLAQDCASVHDADVDFSAAFGINFVFNADLDCCAWGGSTGITLDGKTGFKATWMPPWSWTGGIFAHEISHAFSLPHQGCVGTTNPYDSLWDSVSGALLVHTNSAYKDFLGWIPGARKYVADSSLNQIVSLERLALPGATGYLMAEIPIPGGSTFYTVEARKFAGYDGNFGTIPGEAVVIQIVDWSLEDKVAQVVHTDTVGNNCNGPAGRWTPGELYVDEENNISIAVISASTTGFTIAINPTADLAITKTATPDPATAGQLLTYDVKVVNNGPGPATGVVVTDTLPSGVTFIADTDSCTQEPVGTLTCTLAGSLAAGAEWNFSIHVMVNPNLVAAAGGPTTVTNTASVTSSVADTDLSNNQVSLATLVVDRADLRILKECKPDQPNAALAGTETFCDIYVDNLGPSNARNVVVTDQIIGSTPFTVTNIQLSSTSGPPGSCTATPIGPTTNTTITCTDTVLPAGARNTIKVWFTANDTGDIDNTATVSSATFDPDNSNNSAVGRVSFIAAADLQLTKSGAPNPVIGGQTLTYEITVTNNGPSPATSVVVHDNLPAQVTNVSVSSPGNTCNVGVPGDPAQPLTCNMGTIANGAVETITITVTVKANTPHGTILFNQARVSSPTADPNNGNNSQSASTTVNASADLIVEKTSDADWYKPSTTVTYRVRVTNDGPSDAQNVVLTDDLPEIRQAIYVSDTGGCVFSAPKTLTCNLGTLQAGQSVEFFIYVMIRGSQGEVVNTVSVTSTTFDPNTANNTKSRTVIVSGKQP
jgi:uncharacterized repeat protein (TIGR01451 family)